MAYRIAGTYVASCSCEQICPCPVDQRPNDPNGNGECRGVAAFAIREGNLDDVDLSGVNFALYNFFPSNITAGNWKVAVVVDDGASDEQAEAIGRILSGEEGGPFGEFAPLIGENLGLERAAVTVSDGGRASVGELADYSFEAFTGPDGSPTTVRGAMFGFAPEYRIGKTSGRATGFGLDFEPAYGESAEFEFSTEATGAIHPRA